MNGTVWFSFRFALLKSPLLLNYKRWGGVEVFPYAWYGFISGLLYTKVLYFSTIKGGVE